jgi:hypothetical protein
MPKPKLSSNHPKPKKVIQPITHNKAVKPIKPAENNEYLSPVEEDLGLQKILKSDAYDSILNDIRRDLSKPEQLFSRLIHAKGMDKLNDILVKTIARPSALFIGGLVTLIVTITTYSIARVYGYHYNYLLFLYAFVAGYILEIVAEFIFNLLIAKFKN